MLSVIEISESLILHSVEADHLWLINMEAVALLQNRILCKRPPDQEHDCCFSESVSYMTEQGMDRGSGCSFHQTDWELAPYPLRVQELLCSRADTLSECAAGICSESSKYKAPALEQYSQDFLTCWNYVALG